MNVDLYGLPVDAAPFDITNTRYFSGENDATLGVSKLQTDFLTSTTPGVTETSTTTYTLRTSVDISSYLIALYEGGAVAGDFAVLRLSMDNPDRPSCNVTEFVPPVAPAPPTRRPKSPC